MNKFHVKLVDPGGGVWQAVVEAVSEQAVRELVMQLFGKKPGEIAGRLAVSRLKTNPTLDYRNKEFSYLDIPEQDFLKRLRRKPLEV